MENKKRTQITPTYLINRFKEDMLMSAYTTLKLTHQRLKGWIYIVTYHVKYLVDGFEIY